MRSPYLYLMTLLIYTGLLFLLSVLFESIASALLVLSASVFTGWAAYRITCSRVS